MFTFESREEGLFAVHENGRAAATIFTRTVGETNDNNLRVQQKVVTPLSREKWLIHFTGYRFTLSELKAFLEELAQQEG